MSRTIDTFASDRDRSTDTEPWNVAERDDFTHIGGSLPTPDTFDMPDPRDERGVCPDCGAVVVANLYRHATRGYLTRYECWHALRQHTRDLCEKLAQSCLEQTRAVPDKPCEWYSVP